MQAENHPTRPAATFPPHSPLRSALLERVDAFFKRTGRRRDGGVRLRLKSAILFAWLVASYLLLVLWAQSPWTAIPLVVSVGLAVAGIGFNVQHDGGHDAYARSRFGNRLAAYALDLVGGSSYVWRHKHAVLHHHFTNLPGLDDDVDAGPFLRLAPAQRRRRYHRFQHWYAWALFGLLPAKWAFHDDFRSAIRGRVGPQRMPRPSAHELALMMLGKAAYVGWVFVVPLLVGNTLGNVLLCYAVGSVVTGICLSVVFQLAHCVEEAEFPDAPAPGERVERPWVEHQLATTVDFAPRNPLLTWYLGGLNFQVEHHLFPRVSHVHYPALAGIVRETCAEFGVTHRSHAGVFAALASHARHLRRLGQPEQRLQVA